MSYIKAEEVLPIELVQEIQKYISGKTIYIPRKQGEQAGWGKMSGYRSELLQRNHEIIKLYQEGAAVKMIAHQYFLSEKSIYRILKDKAKED